jgi:hypothetical protein
MITFLLSIIAISSVCTFLYVSRHHEVLAATVLLSIAGYSIAGGMYLLS